MKGKKIVTLLLATLCIVSLLISGCKKDTTKDTNNDNGKDAVEQNKDKADNKDTEEKVTVEFWHGYTAEKTEVLDGMIAEYEKQNPNVKINAKFVATGEEMLQKVQTALLSGEEPNMLWGYPTWTGVLESSGKLVDMGEILDDELKSDLPIGLLEAGKYKGRIYSVPIEAGTLYLIYNKDMFKEAGIDNPPTTWEELYDISKKLSDGDRYGVWLPIAPNERTTWTFETFLWQNGQDVLNAEGNNIGFNNEKGLEALEFYTKMIKDGYAPTAVGQDPFIDKQVAMVYATQGAANAYINKYEMNVGVAMLPGKDKLATGLGSNHYFMFKSDDKVQQETLKFIKYMTTGENHAEWAIKAGYLPVSNSARESDKYKQFGEENPHMIEAAKALTYGVARPPIEEYPKLSTAISETIEKIAIGDMTPEKGMKQIQDEANKIFK
ncbi:ABC transporter substrate-binding protein [Vallitalea guaymasensis]|uniref:ABC transporter substrate-binding protein n=1 Tax=Vallitalea guaymasensis TaxID=1185412 RepID=UPI002356C92D|nr:ABC transporter substrate-binding protein [Vallitalea guaymasensis]